MRHGRRRGMDLGNLPWLPIAAVIGVVAVVIIAALFFLGGGTGGDNSPAPAGSSTPSPQTPVKATQGVAAITVRETTAPAVPPTGTWVMVEYIGSFKGSYGIPSDIQKVENSGIRLYEVVNATGTVKAEFQKKDGSTKHDLTVTIYQDGKAVKFAKNSSAYGIVTVQYP